MDNISYALGLGIGQQLLQMGGSNLNIDDFATAIKDVIAGNELKMSHAEAQKVVQIYFSEQEEKQKAEAAEKGKAAKVLGEKYLADNAIRRTEW
jgi:FKBP-type peptidyl-prolyl cis-trans isomerase FklB